jgi:hypothetical protein
MKKPSGPCSNRFRPGDICRVCGWRRRRPGNRECEECIARQATGAAREDARGRARRTERGNKWQGKAGDCERCTAPAVGRLDGETLCRGHLDTMAELAQESG